MKPYLWLPLLLVPALHVHSSELETGALNASYLGPLVDTGTTTTSVETFSLLAKGSPNEVEIVSRALLEPRQRGSCSAGPGGPVCSPTTCCAAGRRCCPDGCCGATETCMGGGRCCPQPAQTCGGSTCCQPTSICCPSSPTGCCVAGSTCCTSSRAPCCPPGSTCCGNTCCSSSETCERNTCVNTAMITSKRVVRFDLDEKKNGHLLRNMCNGMRGENTMVLTYSGQMSKSAKAKKRSDAGCKSGYCRKLGQPGLNSCDEFPPASSDEGGNTLDVLRRAINCIPGKQNSRQGQRFSAMVQSSGIKKGQKFVISIDCDEVLGGIVPRSKDWDGEISEGPGDLIGLGDEPFEKRDVLDLRGTSNADNIFLRDSSLNETTNTLIVDFGDLGAGKYKIDFKVETGSIEPGGFIIDNLGDKLANVTSVSSLQPGDEQTVSFTIEAGGELMGVGLILPTRNTATTVSWVFSGEDLSPEDMASGSATGVPSPVNTDTNTDVGGALSLENGRVLWLLLLSGVATVTSLS